MTTARRARDLRRARLAGILAGLGIRPRRPRTPSERLDAALKATDQEKQQ